MFKQDRKPTLRTKIHFLSAALEGGYQPHYRAYYATFAEAQSALRDYGVWGVGKRWEKGSDYLRLEPDRNDPNALREYIVHERIALSDTGLSQQDLEAFDTLSDVLNHLNSA